MICPISDSPTSSREAPALDAHERRRTMPPDDTSSPIADSLLGCCPPPFRPEAQRALEMRLKRAVAELGYCVAAALEIERPVTARRIEGVRLRAAEAAALVGEDWR